MMQKKKEKKKKKGVRGWVRRSHLMNLQFFFNGTLCSGFLRAGDRNRRDIILNVCKKS